MLCVRSLTLWMSSQVGGRFVDSSSAKRWVGLEDGDDWQRGYLRPGAALRESHPWLGKWRRLVPSTCPLRVVARGRSTDTSGRVETMFPYGGRLMLMREAMDGYEFDIFISYRRTGNVAQWVQNHFEPRLRACLTDELIDEPRIFLDRDIEVGTRWPDELARALHRSHLLLAVWSPPYFVSRWCLAEWRTMLQREALLGIDESRGLIYPIRFSDGDTFPLEAQNVQQETSFKEWRLPYPQFAESQKYLDFHQAVVGLAERLAARLTSPPPWRPDWPTLRPDPDEPRLAQLPRL